MVEMAPAAEAGCQAVRYFVPQVRGRLPVEAWVNWSRSVCPRTAVAGLGTLTLPGGGAGGDVEQERPPEDCGGRVGHADVGLALPALRQRRRLQSHPRAEHVAQ